MKIKFTKFEKNDNWVNGLVNDGEFYFEAKLFEEGSIHGINEGRVSKLSISIGDSWTGFKTCITNYDRGWDIKPQTAIAQAVYNEVLDFLENAPKTRFDY
ncbi:hypothetical protein [Bacillus phage vB_BanS-Thrax4]|nr:hypothetical protein [Bacillus phage vB_BanS-Thrax4]